MAMALRASTNEAEVFAALDAWVDGVHDVAVPRTLNKVMDQAETAGLRVVASLYRVGPRTMEKYLTRGLAKPGDLVATLTAKGLGFPLYVFQPRQTRAGVSVLLKGRRVTIPHAFFKTRKGKVISMKSGHVGVFARGAYGGKGKINPTGETSGRFHFGKGRFAINELFTFGPPQAMNNRDVIEAMNDRAREQIPAVLAQEIRYASRG